jgi:PilZ domain-containing protein
MRKRRISTPQRPVLPGEAIMLGAPAKKRSTARIQARRPAWITFKAWLQHEHVALVRDISEKGVFFYSDFHPAVGDRLDFVVEYLTGSDRVRLHLKGSVVRVEREAPGAAPGVAVCFCSQRDEVPLVTVREA